jgi:hypothetical protein
MFRNLTLNYSILTHDFPRVGALFLRVGALFLRVGALFLRVGALFLRVGALFLSVGALFLLVSDLVIPSCDAGALATLAFLVVLRVLIKLFFSIDIVFTSSLLKFCLSADSVR